MGARTENRPSGSAEAETLVSLPLRWTDALGSGEPSWSRATPLNVTSGRATKLNVVSRLRVTVLLRRPNPLGETDKPSEPVGSPTNLTLPAESVAPSKFHIEVASAPGKSSTVWFVLNEPAETGVSTVGAPLSVRTVTVTSTVGIVMSAVRSPVSPKAVT